MLIIRGNAFCSISCENEDYSQQQTVGIPESGHHCIGAYSFREGPKRLPVDKHGGSRTKMATIWNFSSCDQNTTSDDTLGFHLVSAGSPTLQWNYWENESLVHICSFIGDKSILRFPMRTAVTLSVSQAQKISYSLKKVLLNSVQM